MGWRDMVQKIFRRQASGQVAALSRGASGEATLPRQNPMSTDSGMSGSYMQLATMLSVDTDLMLRYADYENMDDTETVSAALDIYADNATVVDTVRGKTIWALSKDKVIRDIINDLLDRRLHIEDDLWTAIRTLVKYGNLFGEVIANEKGVLGWNWLPAPTMRRIVDQRGTLVGYVQDPTGAFALSLNTQEDLDRLRQQQGTNSAVFFSPWEVVHWRLRGKQMRALYGFAVLDSVRWVWKRLLMLEDSTLVLKLQKAPARFAFYIDTGEIPPREARAMVDDVRRRYKKKRIMDPSTGRIDFRFNPVEQSEDFFIPTRSGKDATRIEVLSGPDYDETGVLSYFQKKFYLGIRIPPQYLGVAESANRASLAQEDAFFARFIQRIQREFLTGLRQVVRVHLAALNIDPDSVRWDLEMPTPSSIFEMQQVEVWNARAGLAAALQPFFTAPWIMANIFHMSDEDALFAAEAKTHEAEAQALGQASIQAEIMRQFPELGPEGAMAAGAPQPMAGMGAPGMMQQPNQEQIPQESIKRIEKALHQLQEANDRMLKSVDRTDTSVSRIGQRLRVIGQTNQSKYERQAR
jgi:hypothetical protein